MIFLKCIFVLIKVAIFVMKHMTKAICWGEGLLDFHFHIAILKYERSLGRGGAGVDTEAREEWCLLSCSSMACLAYRI